MSYKFTVRCRTCRRVVLRNIVRLGDRETDALVSHLKECRSDLVSRGDQEWRIEMGPLLEQFDVTSER